VGPCLNLRGVWVVQPKSRTAEWKTWVDFESIVYFNVKWLSPNSSRKGYALSREAMLYIEKWCEDNPNRGLSNLGEQDESDVVSESEDVSESDQLEDDV
jgi:hypothetical protein